MFDSIFEIGSVFDWISPVAALIGDIAHGGGHGFAIPAECGYSGNEIKRILSSRGIESWGWMVTAGYIQFNVPKEQGRRAAYVLDEAGIPT